MNLLNDTPIPSSSPLAEMAMSWVCHFNTSQYHRKGYLMLHHLAGGTIQVANLDNYNWHPQGDGNKRMAICNVHKKDYYLEVLRHKRVWIGATDKSFSITQ